MMPPTTFIHLSALTDETGVFEHALFDAPRREHGYCVDDNARALVVTLREPRDRVPSSAAAELARLTETYLAFLEESVSTDGIVCNRRSVAGVWSDPSGSADWWGRAVWAFGAAAALAPDEATRIRGYAGFATATATASATPAGTVRPLRDLRPIVFAALGAAGVLGAYPDDLAARQLLERLGSVIPHGVEPSWPWPEALLRYANAAIPEALIAAGAALGDDALLERGLALLAFLVRIETRDDRLSVTGAAGRGPGERGAQFDQQPIEVAALADACARAFAVTGDAAWLDTVELAWRWFEGVNDGGIPMVDARTGAGFDGLQASGRNENRGAESTIAAMSVRQQARRLERAVLA